MKRSRIVIGLIVLVAVSISSYFIFLQGSNDSAVSQDEYIPIQRSNGEMFNLSIKEIPEYHTYLSSQSDRKAEIKRTQYEILRDVDKSMLILLKYSCGNKQCATQLVKINDSDVSSIPLPVAVFQDYKFSPNHERVLLRYAVNEGDVVRHQVVALDIIKMKVIPFESPALEDEYRKVPKWPITDYQWINDNEFTLHVAAVDSSSFESLEQWFKSDGETTKQIHVSLSEAG